MSHKSEILVLQIGNQANYVNSHIWNTRLQSQLNNNQFYHTNRNDSKSFPRCVIIESPHQLGSIYTSSSDEINTKKQNNTWEGHVHTAINSRFHHNVLQEHTIGEDKSSYHSTLVATLDIRL